MNQRLETSNKVENFENLEAKGSSEQIESIQEIQDSINLELEETQVSVEAREISTEEVWGEIAGKTIKGGWKNQKITIQNLQKLSGYDFTKGRIEETRKPLREYLNKIFEIEGKNKAKISTNKVNGIIKLKLYKGNVLIQSRMTTSGAYSMKKVSFEENKTFNKSNVERFINFHKKRLK